MTMHIKVAGVWKNVPTLKVRVSTVWKNITDAWVKVSGTWKKFLASGPVVAIPTINPSAYVLGAPATAEMRFERDGDCFQAVTGPGDTQLADWVNPSTGTVGDGYWIRVTTTSGSFTSGPANNTWVQLNTNRTWTKTASSIGSVTVSANVAIATDSGGSNIVATGSVTLTAEYGNPE